MIRKQIEFENDEYTRFVEKFKPKKTTDDCYTPPEVFEAIEKFVFDRYGIRPDQIIRPFWPDKDYRKTEYPEGSCVVDNPPFSILAQILTDFNDEGVKYFLFCPALTAFSSFSSSSSSVLCVGYSIEYENGAKVNTSFVTNLEPANVRARSEPGLFRALKEAQTEKRKAEKKEIPKYSYPDNVVTAAMLCYFSVHDTEYSFSKEESRHIRALDMQRSKGKTIFGSGYLLSEKAAAEKAAAEKAAAEKAAAEKAAAEKAAAEKAAAEKWELSEREKEIIKSLSGRR